jgi:hypothetical protein
MQPLYIKPVFAVFGDKNGDAERPGFFNEIKKARYRAAHISDITAPYRQPYHPFEIANDNR